jgi:hypothetical protein
MDIERKAEIGEEIIAWAREGQQVRAEMLSERLDLAIDELLSARLQGREDDLNAKRQVLFYLYEREILTRGQVRARGELDAAEFYEELRAYRRRRVTK